ncbi:NAD(+) synthase [Chloroflexota bacterium]
MEKLAQKLSDWIKKQIQTAGCKGAVLGLSGGIDSAVVAVLCNKALPQTTLGVMLPCHSSKADMTDAQALASKFNIDTTTVVLDSIYNSLITAVSLEDTVDEHRQKLSHANLKPRLRMTSLYYIANQLNYLVVGTSNKSELTVGYYTKYGDGGADITPLGNLVKGQVKQLAVHLGIPQQIIDKPPSAGLWSGQTDESEMGITYDQLDTYITCGEGDEDICQQIEVMVRSSTHKRKPAPIPPF